MWVVQLVGPMCGCDKTGSQRAYPCSSVTWTWGNEPIAKVGCQHASHLDSPTATMEGILAPAASLGPSRAAASVAEPPTPPITSDHWMRRSLSSLTLAPGRLRPRAAIEGHLSLAVVHVKGRPAAHTGRSVEVPDVAVDPVRRRRARRSCDFLAAQVNLNHWQVVLAILVSSIGVVGVVMDVKDDEDSTIPSFRCQEPGR